MQTKYFLYEIVNPLGHVYVGITVNIKARFSCYKGLRCKKQHIIYNSLLKYGISNHNFVVIRKELCRKEAEESERRMIKLYKQNNSSLNIKGGGFSGVIGEDSSSAVPVIQFSIKGDVVKRWSCGMDIRRNFGIESGLIANACTVGYRTNYALGYLWQYESDYKKGVPLRYNPKNHKVVQFTLSGKYLKTWESASEASRSLTVTSCSISSASNFAYNSNLSGGFLWLNYDDYLLGKIPTYPHRDPPIVQMSLDGDYIKTWYGISSTSNAFGINKNTLREAISTTGCKTSCGFIWQYEYLYNQGFKKQDLWSNTQVFRQSLKKEQAKK